jgi:hypothetical protein
MRSQQSKGDGTLPLAFCRKRKRERSEGMGVTTTPLRTSEWPPRYFVALWTTTEAPRVSGFW